MKRTIRILTVALPVLIVAIVIGCQSSGQKEQNAREKVQDAKQDLKEAKNDVKAEAQKIATSEEWQTFKSDTEKLISDNEKIITELKAKIKKTGKSLDSFREKRIDKLEQQNRDLKARLEAYENNQTDWESFKSEFNHDMNELGKALKDLTVDNK